MSNFTSIVAIIMDEINLPKGETWRNKKTGNIYAIRGFATHSETLKPLVLYARLGSNSTWARPLEMWEEKFIPEDLTQYTCHECSDRPTCPFAYDRYNISGDCLAIK